MKTITFILFFSLSTLTSAQIISPSFEIDTSLGDAIFVQRSESYGLRITSTKFRGISITSTGQTGVSLGLVGNPSTQFNPPSALNGFDIKGAQGNGLYVGFADLNGVHVHNASGYGIYANGSLGSAFLQGNVGIGTEPNSLLDLKQASGLLELRMKTGNSWTAKISMDPSSLLQFHNGSDVRMTIEAGGNVGIGTTDPNYLLDVNGNTRIVDELNRGITGSSDLLPICYGSITGLGGIQSGSGNFTVQNGTPCSYIITISGETYNDENFVTIVSSNGGQALWAATNDGNLGVSSDSGIACRGFSFIVYKL